MDDGVKTHRREHLLKSDTIMMCADDDDAAAIQTRDRSIIKRRRKGKEGRGNFLAAVCGTEITMKGRLTGILFGFSLSLGGIFQTHS